MSFYLQHEHRRFLADLVTPVGLFSRLRRDSSPAVLLESSDYRGSENNRSFLATGEIASIEVTNGKIFERYPDGSEVVTEITRPQLVGERLEFFRSSFVPDGSGQELPAAIKIGLFGYIAYDAIQYFEKIAIDQPLEDERSIPLIRYSLFSHVIVINHFTNELYLVRTTVPRHEGRTYPYESLNSFAEAMFERGIASSSFARVGEESSNFTEDEYVAVVQECQKHIQRGDIFQIVPSRRFAQPFRGDEFNVYRALRSINPSPYLFYFDYERFRLFGSSPEAELVVDLNRQATLFPIAGTFPRGSSEAEDQQRAAALLADPKESAEHVMLVDLARNDLSKHCDDVRVESFKEVQFYSHVIHLVSKVAGTLRPGATSLSVLIDTFPAGTLSGAPKHRAMQLIDKYERGARGFYGGCIGYLGFGEDLNHAIMIRTFVSKQNVLYSQSGGGVTIRSRPEGEGEEVVNKLRALKRAILDAEELGRE